MVSPEASSSSSTALADSACRLLSDVQAAHEREVEELWKAQAAEIEELKRRLSCVELADTSMFKQEKRQFFGFVKGALKGKESPEYKQLYHYLLKCFTDADNNFDGRVGFKEFEMLIEAAAFLPRRFGYAPSTPELYKTDWERLQARMTLFNALKITSEGSRERKEEFITFAKWLEYAVGHIAEKAKSLQDSDMQGRLETSKEDFRAFVIAAAKSRHSREYKELYHFVLKCFTDADTDLDGLIDLNSFQSLIDIAVIAPRRFGFAPQSSDMYTSEEQKFEARAKIFRSLDPGGTGYIDFDTWLHYIYTHICEKTAFLGESGAVPAIVAASSADSTYSRSFLGWK